EVPLDRLVVETDAPFCTPVPYRGKTNEPAYVAYVARKLADLHGISENDVRRATTRNVAKLFSLPILEADNQMQQT
ncbi:MAG: TatD family hydrolase, partial [Phycisphaerae bacterium]|nr:TatD family hydrolase [Phycisphaerae bacterium]